ncbi:collagenase [Manduca sexta]|uniref:Peptidase S1 domain-containing protein n=1 Tax=Manduca sexta TaxID=7130 RepID=A0A921YPL3_MANSE|nr:collagenase [Manduca sexta]KAG6443068.1 hypothetical protein O3G_MSEX002662 [Manduca sexta]KAG6443069.1 hypothetical protein O3G_MSEX002662 [Manduca sexta]
MAAWRGVFALLSVSVALTFGSPLASFPEHLRADSRIVSGWEAEEAQFPYQLSMRMVNATGGVTACGATIIHSEWGLTAAHCTAGRISIVIRAGTVNVTRPGLIFETTNYINHPWYNEDFPTVVQPHDIGLLKFERVLKFNNFIQPIRIHNSADKNRNYEGHVMTATGWGRTWTGGSSPENMNWVYLLGVSHETCLEAFRWSPIIQPSTICAAYFNVTSQSTCQGDSGGGLTVVDDDGVISQVGVSSFVSGSGCHTPIPAGFVRPGHYHEWYLEVTGINFDWSHTTPEPETEPDSESSESDSESESDSSESDSSESSESEEDPESKPEPEAF